MTYEQAFMFFLPRICEHCLNPSCVASCPSGAMYKREEDGIVLVDQDRCRGWRYCVSGCPYKKVYFNHRTGKAEKCTLCYPRIEVGQPTICSETCVGRIRYLGLVLYDADRIEAAASVPDERDLLAAQRDVFLDPEDAEVQAAARDAGIPGDWIDAARRSPIYDLAMRWGVALPLHPEFRTLPMVWYVPPLSPVVSTLEVDGYEADPDDVFGAIDHLRIPLEYLANLLTAGDVDEIRAVLHRLAAMRALHAQARGARGDRRVGARAGRSDRASSSSACTGCWRSPTTRTATSSRRRTRSSAGSLMEEQGACGLDFDGGPGNCGAVAPGDEFHLLDDPRARSPGHERAAGTLLLRAAALPGRAVAAAHDEIERSSPPGAVADCARALRRRLDRRPRRDVRRDVRPAPAREPQPDLLRPRRHAQARHGAAAAEEALPRRRPAAGEPRAARLPGDHARVRRAGTGRLRRGAAGASTARRSSCSVCRCTTSSSPYAHVLDAVAPLLPPLSVTERSRGRPARARRPAGRSRRPRAVRPAGGDAAYERGRRSCSGSSCRTWRSRPSSSALVALPHGPVRLDEPVDPADRAQDPRLGRAGLPLRRAGRDRRPRDRAADPEVVHRDARHLRERVPLVLRDRRRHHRRRLRRRVPRPRVPAGDERPRAPHDLAHRPARLLPAGRADRDRLLVDVRAQPARRALRTTTASRSRRGGARCSCCSPTSRPRPAAATIYQVHAIVAWAFWALFPFSRLVHAWSIPLQYLGRPYILYRRRYPERAR